MWWRPCRGVGTPRGLSRSRLACVLTGPPCRTVRHTLLWPSPTSVVCLSQLGGSWAHCPSRYCSTPKDPEAGLGPSQGPSPGVQKEGSCLQHPLCWVPLHLHWTDREVIGPVLARTSSGPQEGRCHWLICCGKACVWSRPPGLLVYLSKASVIEYHPHIYTHCLLESWHIQHHQAPSTERGAPCQDSMQLCWTD